MAYNALEWGGGPYDRPQVQEKASNKGGGGAEDRSATRHLILKGMWPSGNTKLHTFHRWQILGGNTSGAAQNGLAGEWNFNRNRFTLMIRLKFLLSTLTSSPQDSSPTSVDPYKAGKINPQRKRLFTKLAAPQYPNQITYYLDNATAKFIAEGVLPDFETSTILQYYRKPSKFQFWCASLNVVLNNFFNKTYHKIYLKIKCRYAA